MREFKKIKYINKKLPLLKIVFPLVYRHLKYFKRSPSKSQVNWFFG